MVEEAASTDVAEDQIDIVLHYIVCADGWEVVALSCIDTTLQAY